MCINITLETVFAISFLHYLVSMQRVHFQFSEHTEMDENGMQHGETIGWLVASLARVVFYAYTLCDFQTAQFIPVEL